jgi:hypothetical protein
VCYRGCATSNGSYDHVRIEHMLFDGAPEPHDSKIAPDFSRPGFGVVFKKRDAERFRTSP